MQRKDKLIAEYALSDVNKPIGISAYQLTQALPDKLKSSLPSIEEIEAELAKDLGLCMSDLVLFELVGWKSEATSDMGAGWDCELAFGEVT